MLVTSRGELHMQWRWVKYLWPDYSLDVVTYKITLQEGILVQSGARAFSQEKSNRITSNLYRKAINNTKAKTEF